jgi:hypothetical protein
MFQPHYPLERLACAQWVKGHVTPFGRDIAMNSRLCQEQTSIVRHSVTVVITLFRFLVHYLSDTKKKKQINKISKIC